jgi:hypothetical protein
VLCQTTTAAALPAAIASSPWKPAVNVLTWNSDPSGSG